MERVGRTYIVTFAENKHLSPKCDGGVSMVPSNQIKDFGLRYGVRHSPAYIHTCVRPWAPWSSFLALFAQIVSWETILLHISSDLVQTGSFVRSSCVAYHSSVCTKTKPVFPVRPAFGPRGMRIPARRTVYMYS